MNPDAYVEKYISCPYDASHRIICHRFLKHLVKCGKAKPNHPTEVCPFNSGHIVPKSELNYHMYNCLDRDRIDKVYEVVKIQNTYEIDFTKPVGELDEDEWDHDATLCYNPGEYCEGKMTVRWFDIAPTVKRDFLELELLEKLSKNCAYKMDIRKLPPVLPAARMKEKILEVLAAHIKQISLSTGSRRQSEPQPEARPPPLSQILTSARTGASRADDEWEDVPARGQGCGFSKNKN